MQTALCVLISWFLERVFGEGTTQMNTTYQSIYSFNGFPAPWWALMHFIHIYRNNTDTRHELVQPSRTTCDLLTKTIKQHIFCSDLHQLSLLLFPAWHVSTLALKITLAGRATPVDCRAEITPAHGQWERLWKGEKQTPWPEFRSWAPPPTPHTSPKTGGCGYQVCLELKNPDHLIPLSQVPMRLMNHLHQCFYIRVTVRWDSKEP